MTASYERRLVRRRAGRSGQAIPCTSIAEYERCTSIKLTDREVLRLVLLETDMAAFVRSAAFNARFHNRTTAELSTEQLQILGLGHKFIPTRFGPSKATVGKALRQLARRLYLRDFFAQRGDDEGPGPPPDPRLRVRNSDWHPLRDGLLVDENGDPTPYVPSRGVQEFLNDVDQQVHAALGRVRRMPLVDNLSAAQRAAVTALRADPAVVICESDKNQGLMVLDAADYRQLGQEALQASAVEVTADSLGCAAADVEATIIAGVREQLAAVLQRYSGLLGSESG